MKKLFIAGLILALGANLVEARQTTTSTPFEIKKADSSKINAVKTNQASCGCGGGCNTGDVINPVGKVNYITVKNAQTLKLAKTLAAQKVK